MSRNGSRLEHGGRFVMTERKTIYKDSFGIRRTLITEDDHNRFSLRVQTQQQIDGILDHAAAFRDVPQPGAFKKVAVCPIEVYERSLLEGWDDADWTRWLNDPDNALLRTWPGKV